MASLENLLWGHPPIPVRNHANWSKLSLIHILLYKRAADNLSAFRTFVRFVLVWICRFPLPLSLWEGLRFVIVALPGLFSYLFFFSGDTYITEKVRVVSLALDRSSSSSLPNMKAIHWRIKVTYKLWRRVNQKKKEKKKKKLGRQGR